MTWANPGDKGGTKPSPPPSQPKGHGSSDTSDPNVHVSESQKYKYTEAGQLIQPVSTSGAAQVVSIKPGQVTYETSEQVAARQSAIVGGSIDPSKVQSVSPLGTVVFGPSTQQGAVEGEVARIAAKYPGYVAPNAQTQAYNIAQKFTPLTPNSGGTYPAWSGRQSDMEGGVRALAVAQEVGYYNGGMVASSAGPMPGRMVPVVRVLHERMGIPFGGGMAGELLPESALSLGFERLFERRGREGLGVKPTLEVKGGTVHDISYSDILKAPSGTIFTVTKTPAKEAWVVGKGTENEKIFVNESAASSYADFINSGVNSYTDYVTGEVTTKTQSPINYPIITTSSTSASTTGDIFRGNVIEASLPGRNELSQVANYGLGIVLDVLGTRPTYNEYVQREWGLSRGEYEALPLWVQMGTSERASALKTSLAYGREEEIRQQGVNKEYDIRGQLQSSLNTVNMAYNQQNYPMLMSPGTPYLTGVTNAEGKLITAPKELSAIRTDIESDLKNLHSNIGLETQYQISSEGATKGIAYTESMRLIGDVYVGAVGGLAAGGPPGMLLGSIAGGITYYAGKEVGSQVTVRSEPLFTDLANDKYIGRFVAEGTGRVARFGTEFAGAYYTPSIVKGTLDTASGLYTLAKSPTGAFTTGVGPIKAAYVKMPGQQGWAVGTDSKIWASGGPEGFGLGAKGFKPFTQAAPEGTVFMVETSTRDAGRMATNVLLATAEKDSNFIASELTRAKSGIALGRLLEYQKSIYHNPIDIANARNIVENLPVKSIENMRGVLADYSEKGDIFFRYKGSLTNIAQMSPEAQAKLTSMGYGEAKDVDIEIIHTPYSSLTPSKLRSELITVGEKGGAKLQQQGIGITTTNAAGQKVKLFDVLDAGEINTEGGVLKGTKYRFGLDVEQGYIIIGGKPVQKLSEGNLRYLSTSISFQNVGGVGFVNPELYRLKDIHRFEEGTAPSLISSAKSDLKSYVTGVKAQEQLDIFKSTRVDSETPQLERVLKTPRKESTKTFGSGIATVGEGKLEFDFTKTGVPAKTTQDSLPAKTTQDSFYASGAAYGKMKPNYDKTLYYSIPPSTKQAYANYKPHEQYTPYTPYKPYSGYKPYKAVYQVTPEYKTYTQYTKYTKYTPYKSYTPYTPYKPYEGYTPYKPYTPYTPYPMPRGGSGVLWASGGLLGGGKRRRGKSQRFVPAFIPSGGELFELFGEGRRVSRRASKKRRR